MYNSVEHIKIVIKTVDKYSKKSGNLQQFCGDEPKNPITNSESFKFKPGFLNDINNAGIINAEIAVPLKCFYNFWITLKMLLINCEINCVLTSLENCAISEGNIF